MNLTTKGRYAITAILDLALHYTDKPVSLTDIATRQGLSLSYLDQLFSKLKQANLIVSYRGPGGGYGLAKDTHDIMISEVILAVNERIDATRCQGESNCQNGHRCLTHDLWQELSDEIYKFFSSMSLAQFINRPNVRKIAERQNQIQQAGYRSAQVLKADELISVK